MKHDDMVMRHGQRNKAGALMYMYFITFHASFHAIPFDMNMVNGSFIDSLTRRHHDNQCLEA